MKYQFIFLLCVCFISCNTAKKEEVKAAPAEKPKDNVESLPPTDFNLYDFKTFYVNH